MYLKNKSQPKNQKEASDNMDYSIVISLFNFQKRICRKMNFLINNIPANKLRIWLIAAVLIGIMLCIQLVWKGLATNYQVLNHEIKSSEALFPQEHRIKTVDLGLYLDSLENELVTDSILNSQNLNNYAD